MKRAENTADYIGLDGIGDLDPGSDTGDSEKIVVADILLANQPAHK
jgi:hypothetical protein